MNSDGLGYQQAASPRGQTLEVRIPPNPRFGREVRRQVFSFADQFQVSRNDLDEFIFAVGEALANAIEHSHSSDVIEVRCSVEEDKILASIVDSGAGFSNDPVAGIHLPDAMSERGRGLPIMRRYSDIFAVHSVPGRGTAIVLGRYFGRKPDIHDPNQETDIAS
jgi:anti-sigma regulatory factor (Ser/Thr protein kinase)